MASKEAREFSVILVKTEGDQQGPAVAGLSEMLSLERETAEQILKSGPIVLSDGLTKSDVKKVSPKLKELSKTGVELRVTARQLPSLPRVHWEGGSPLMGASAQEEFTPKFDLGNRAFVCPTCGEAFLFQQERGL